MSRRIAKELKSLIRLTTLMPTLKFPRGPTTETITTDDTTTTNTTTTTSSSNTPTTYPPPSPPHPTTTTTTATATTTATFLTTIGVTMAQPGIIETRVRWNGKTSTVIARWRKHTSTDCVQASFATRRVCASTMGS